MYRRILVGSLDSEQGREALALGRIFARANGAEMTVATAPDEDGESLAQMAISDEADLVVLGSSHRSSLGRVIPGATVERLLGEVPCAVAVAPPHFGAPGADADGWQPLQGKGDDVGMRVIGVGYDGSDAAFEALRSAADLAVANGAALRVYTVARKYAHVPGASGDERGPGVPTEADVLRGILNDAVNGLPAATRALPVFLRGFAADELVKATRQGVDLLVLGSRPGGPLRRLLHHSVSSTVMQRAGCPVLISPTGVAAPESSLA